MTVSLAPEATLPDYTHTVLKTMTRDSWDHGWPGATTGVGGCARPSLANEGMHRWA